MATVPFCLMWKIWKARNKVAFKDDILSVQGWRLILFLCSGLRQCMIKDASTSIESFINWVGCK